MSDDIAEAGRPSVEVPDLTAVRLWLRARTEPVDLVLVCADHPAVAQVVAWVGAARPAVVVRVPGCLADVRRGDLVHLLADGACSVRLVMDGCSRPDEVRHRFADLIVLLVGERADAVVAGEGASAAPLVQVWAAPPSSDAPHTPEPVVVLDGRSMPVPRRTLVGAPSTESLPPAAATEHGDLMAALTAVREATGGRVPDQAAAVAVPGPGVMLRAPGCVACGTCVRVCPESALDLRVDKDGAATLTEDVGACSGCRTCVDACPPRVLVVRRPARWSEQLRGGVLPLAQLTVVACTRCSTPTPADEGELCQVCAYRRTHPFGSMPPPHAWS